MAFELASTNMVAELAIILIVLMGWQFAAAEFAGAPLMVFILAFLFRTFLSAQLLQSAKEQDKGIKGVIEGHAEMDMSVTGGPLLKRIPSEKGRTAISHYFVMDWVSIWKDIAGGLLITGALAAWVPQPMLPSRQPRPWTPPRPMPSCVGVEPATVPSPGRPQPLPLGPRSSD